MEEGNEHIYMHSLCVHTCVNVMTLSWNIDDKQFSAESGISYWSNKFNFYKLNL